MTLTLGAAAALSPQTGSACDLELPDEAAAERIASARAELKDTVVLLGHHYQRDEVIRFADYTGDSYKLSLAAAETGARYIVFCGVHFMAESADILARAGQQVILPDLNAGCSMADMAEISQVEACWETLERHGLAGETIVLYDKRLQAAPTNCPAKRCADRIQGSVCPSSFPAPARVSWVYC